MLHAVYLEGFADSFSAVGRVELSEVGLRLDLDHGTLRGGIQCGGTTTADFQSLLNDLS